MMIKSLAGELVEKASRDRAIRVDIKSRGFLIILYIHPLYGSSEAVAG